MVQGVSNTPLYKVVNNQIVRCYSVITLHRAFLTKKQAMSYREEVVKEHLLAEPIVVEIEIEPIDE